MKISIITACYNREKTISKAIESVKNQDYKDTEYIIVDGASNDKSMELINSEKEFINVIISEKDNGIYNALNKGILHSSGDIIGLLHSDDYFYDNHTLTKIANIFENSGADIIYANGLYVDEKDISKTRRVYKSRPFKRFYLYFGWIPLHTTIFVKKDIFFKYGMYEEGFKIASDYEISLRWFTNNNIKKVFLDEWVVKMRLGGKSTDIKQQRLKSSEDLYIIKKFNLLGRLTLLFKIIRKIPQYVLPIFVKFT